MKWINVKDRLPENEKDVLIVAEKRLYNGETRRLVSKAFYTDGKHHNDDSVMNWLCDCGRDGFEYDEVKDDYMIPEGWWECVDYGEDFFPVDDFVTHWMALPAPAINGQKCDDQNDDKDVESIVLNYDDGTSKMIKKGFFCDVKECGEEKALSFTMCHISGQDLETIIVGCIQLGDKLGYFDRDKESE